jgi:hypothetical protein
MAHEDKINPSTTLSDQTDQNREVSRRDVLTGAGVVAGVVTALSATSASAATEDEWGPIGIDKPGVSAGEFRSWIDQSGSQGEKFVSYGFLTKLSGATDLDLFDDPVHDETSALMTFYTEGALQQRVFGQNVHTLDVEATLVIYQRHTGGASASDPKSFKIGTPVAQFALTLQDVLTVFAPGSGLPTLTGDMRQTGVGRVVGIGKSAFGRGGTPFGKFGMRARLLATGLAQRPNPATFDTRSEMSGNWTVEQQ